MRFNKRTDNNQAQIVRELRDRRYQVVVTNMGDDFPDLLVSRPVEPFWMLCEIKDTKPLSRGQLLFIANSKGPICVATTADEVIQEVERGGIPQEGKDRLAQWLYKNPMKASLSLRKFRSELGLGG
jgi:hypothetical protein